MNFQWVSCSPSFHRPLHLAGGDGITGTVQKSPAHPAPQPLKVPLLNFPISPPSPSAKLPPEPSSKLPILSHGSSAPPIPGMC